MERVKVNLPGDYVFSTILKIRITDLNYGGHVGNDVFLSLVHEARQQFLQKFDYSEMNIGGASLIMADAAIEYKHELVYGDEIRISVTASGFDKLGFDIYYLIELMTPTGWKMAGKVKTGMLCYNYELKKKVVVPDEVILKLTGDK